MPAVGLRSKEPAPNPTPAGQGVAGEYEILVVGWQGRWCHQESEVEEILRVGQVYEVSQCQEGRQVADSTTAALDSDEDAPGRGCEVDLLTPPEATATLCNKLERVSVDSCVAQPLAEVELGVIVAEAVLVRVPTVVIRVSRSDI